MFLLCSLWLAAKWFCVARGFYGVRYRDPETDRLCRELARLQGGGITEAVRSAVETKVAA